MAILEGDVKLPGMGEVPKKYVVGGVVIGGGIAVIVYIRGRKASAANAANQTAAQAAVTDPAGNQCAAVDPNSGYCPGSPEDVAWQQNNAGGSSLAGVPGVSSGSVDTSGGSSGATAGGTSAGGPQTNADWMAAALQVLPGGDTPENEAALAGVLGGQTVTTAQKNIFLEAVGLEGQPPQGYPTPIKTSDTAAHPGPGTKTAGNITGLSVKPSGSGIQARWNAATDATGGYEWILSGPEDKRAHTGATSVTIHNLKHGTYNFGIQALPGGQGDNQSVTVG